MRSEFVRESLFFTMITMVIGDIKYKDINNDGIIDINDEVPIGYPTTPKIIYGFGLSSKYKHFDFSFFFQGSSTNTTNKA